MAEESLTEYYKNIQQGKVAPKDPFALSFALLLSDETNILKGDLADKQAMLSYLGDDMMVQFYQLDIEILTRMRNMAIRDKNLLPVFATTYYGWLGSLKITRAKDGLERGMQANAVGGYQPATVPYTGGYGQQFASDQRDAEKQQTMNNPVKAFLSGVMKRKK